MPTYEYICEKCGQEFEFFQSMKDKALAHCPKERCQAKPWGRGKVKRKIGGGAGLIFKGSGFYITDYRSENYKAAAKKETETKSGASAPASGGGASGAAGGSGASAPATPAPAKAPASKPKE